MKAQAVFNARAYDTLFYFLFYYFIQQTNIFENEESELLKNRLGYIIYIKLYYYYLIACLHVSLNHTDLELFKELQKNIL